MNLKPSIPDNESLTLTRDEILKIKEVAKELRCSKTHVDINGKVQRRQAAFTGGKTMKDISDNLDLLTLKEVADLLHCSKAHISKAVSGKLGPAIPSVRLGRRKLIRRAALLAWIESNENGTINTPEQGR